LLALHEPDGSSQALTFFWHFARASAFAATSDVKRAEGERQAFQELYLKIPSDQGLRMLASWSVLHAIVLESTDARIASARGDEESAIGHWRAAIAAESQLDYFQEPPAWYYPVEESLGAALLRAKHYTEAEDVFRKDLKQNPRNPRSLYGLGQSLEAQQKAADASAVHQDFESSWRGGTLKLRIEDF
jgi:tetratricopeptide (TPR) repeat protein